jgi:hypothetical protein
MNRNGPFIFPAEFSDEDNEILNFLGKVDKDLAESYKAIIFFENENNKDFPARLRQIACNIYVIAEFIRRKRGNKWMAACYQHAAFLQKSYKSEVAISDGHDRFIEEKEFFDKFDKEIEKEMEQCCNEKYRHYNGWQARHLEDEKLTSFVEKIKCIIRNGAIPFLVILDDILKKVNDKPTKPDIKELRHYIEDGNFLEYILYELTNPELIVSFKEYFCLVKDDDGNGVSLDEAKPYLLRIASEKPSEVESILNGFIESLKKFEPSDCRIEYLLDDILRIGIKASEGKKEVLNTISKNLFHDAYDIYYNKTPCNYETIADFLKKLLSAGYKDKALEIFQGFLEIKLERHNDKGRGFFAITKFEKRGIFESQHDYVDFFSKVSDIFDDNYNKKKFEIYCNIISRSMQSILGNHGDDFKLHSQHFYQTIEEDNRVARHEEAPFSVIVTAIRGTAESILKTNKKKEDIDFVFKTLQETDSAIFVRLILHLLRLFPNTDKNLIESYLTKEDYFDNSDIHHEYYLLMQQEFEKLPKQKQNIIFKFIDDGPDPKDDWYQTDDEYGTSKEKIRNWKLRKLEPIRNALSGDEKKKYRKFLYDKDGNKISLENPDLLGYVSAVKWVSLEESSPIKCEGKSINEIIVFLQNCKNLEKQTEQGLFSALIKDVAKRPNEYFGNFDTIPDLQFENEDVKYIFLKALFRGLPLNTADDWQKIVRFAACIVKQERGNSCNGCRQDVYATLLDLFIFKLLQSKLQINSDSIQDVLGIICNLGSIAEGSQLEEVTEENDSILNVTLKNLYGRFLCTLIKLALWQCKNEGVVKCVFSKLDKLLDESKYKETWAVLGLEFSNIYYSCFQKWTENNIDKIFPDSNIHKFKAAWIMYIVHNSKISKILLILLKPKFEYAIKNRIGFDCNENSYLYNFAMCLMYYCVIGEIKPDDDLMTSIFEVPRLLQNMIMAAGSVSNGLGKEEKKEYIDRFKLLWEDVISKVYALGDKQPYACVLEAFCCPHPYSIPKLFSNIGDKEWFIEKMYSLIVERKVDTSKMYDIFGNLKEVLKECSTLSLKKIFEIAKKAVYCCSPEQMYEAEEVMEEIFVRICQLDNSEENKYIKKAMKSFIYNEVEKLFRVEIFKKFKKCLENL